MSQIFEGLNSSPNSLPYNDKETSKIAVGSAGLTMEGLALYLSTRPNSVAKVFSIIPAGIGIICLTAAYNLRNKD